MPGPLCRVLGGLKIDAGTMCLSTSPTPGPVGQTKRKKVSPVFSTTPAKRAHILANPEKYIGEASYFNSKGNHECVTFAQKAGGAPLTLEWRPGAHVKPGMAIPRGTWVATFVNGRYQGHVGAFDSIAPEGTLALIDQFNSRGMVGKSKYSVKEQPYTGKISNDPTKYYVLLW